MVENEFSTTIQCIRSDRGGEYLSTEFCLFCDNHGIKRQLTTARTPQQNGVAEWKKRTLLEAARSTQIACGLPTYLWDELIKTANYVLNRCETSALVSSTPFQHLYQVKPDISHLRVIGCLAYVHIPAALRHKLAAKSIRSYLIGYDDKSKAYRCFEPTKRKIYVSRDVIFDESQMYAFSHRFLAHPTSQPTDSESIMPTQHTSISITSNNLTQNLDAIPSNDIDLPPPSPDVIPTAPDLQSSPPDHSSADIEPPSTPTSALSPPSSPSSIPAVELPPVRRQPSRARELPVRLRQDYILSIRPSHPDVCLVETTDYVDENITFQQARLDPGWTAAMREEIDSLIQHDTWALTALPPSKRALSARWVYRAKPEVNPTHTRLKARLVARATEQRSGVDYEDTFAPVVERSTIRLIIALAAAHGWPITQMDVITAFLNGKLKELIYMVQPPGFELPGSEHLVCRLNRSIYGLKQSPRAWYEEIDQFLRSLGWVRSAADSNLYFINVGGGNCTFITLR